MSLLVILVRTPPWVWGMLAALLALGLAQTRPRRVAPARLLLLPLSLLALGLWTMLPGFKALPAAGGLWLVALAATTAVAKRRAPQRQVRWLAGEQRLLLPGSWMPLLLIVTVFCLRYASAVAVAIEPSLAGAARLVWPSALLFGVLSGALLGRAVALLKLTRNKMPAHAAA